MTGNSFINVSRMRVASIILFPVTTCHQWGSLPLWAGPAFRHHPHPIKIRRQNGAKSCNVFVGILSYSGLQVRVVTALFEAQKACI